MSIRKITNEYVWRNHIFLLPTKWRIAYLLAFFVIFFLLFYAFRLDDRDLIELVYVANAVLIAFVFVGLRYHIASLEAPIGLLRNISDSVFVPQWEKDELARILQHFGSVQLVCLHTFDRKTTFRFIEKDNKTEPLVQGTLVPRPEIQTIIKELL